MTAKFDILIAGAGTAGLPAAIFGARAGASVMIIDAAGDIGGTLHLSAGQISAAGTGLQRDKGITDNSDAHYDDIMRISNASSNPGLTRLAVTHLPDTLAWLIESGMAIPPDHPVIDPVNEPYSVPRTYWHPDGGRAILRAILPQFWRAVDSGRVQLALRTQLTRLIVDAGRVVGCWADTPNGPVAYHSKATILATGGFTADTALFTRLTRGKPHYGRGHCMARGQGLLAAIAAGGLVVNEDKFLPAFAAVENGAARDGYSFDTQTNPDVRQPWEIYVDLHGKRFMREDERHLGIRQRALMAAPAMRFWAVYDARIRHTAPSFFSRSACDTIDQRFVEAWPGYVEADSLTTLADKMGVDAAALEETVTLYNRALAQRMPDMFGREHRPCAIAQPPYRAIRHSGWSPTGFAGLGVDERLRVTEAVGRPIPGLYAAGEILGMAATGGQSYCGGMSLGPALTFGRLLGQWLADGPHRV